MKSEFKQYQRTAIAEMREVTKGDIQDFHREGKITIPPEAFGDRENPYRVSISDEDLANGSPTIGDMIARNPKNHNDQWLVAKQYFEDNFKPDMNKELTAMQMLYELIDSEVDRLSKVKGEHKKASEQCANQLVILKMKVNDMNLLQKEQEQIEKAFEVGYSEGVFRGNIIIHADDGVTPYKYYQSKYGGEE